MKQPTSSPFSGPIFEDHVACEIAKAQQHHGRRRELYFLRDKTGVEVDFALPLGGRRLALVEARTTRTVLPRMGDPVRLFHAGGQGLPMSGVDRSPRAGPARFQRRRRKCPRLLGRFHRNQDFEIPRVAGLGEPRAAGLLYRPA